MQGLFDADNIIDRYTRAEAIADGVLTDVSKLAKEAGFNIPVALSTGVITKVNEAVKAGLDYEGVIWDIFSVLKYYIKTGAGKPDNHGGKRIDFFVYVFNPKRGRNVKVPMYYLSNRGDHMEPVITILLPDED